MVLVCVDDRAVQRRGRDDDAVRRLLAAPAEARDLGRERGEAVGLVAPEVADASQAAGGVGEYGERVAWMKTEGAEATMNYLTGSKLIDVRKPENSLLLLKPLKARLSNFSVRV